MEVNLPFFRENVDFESFFPGHHIEIDIYLIQNISIFLASTRQSTAKSGGSRSSTAKSTTSAKSESGTTLNCRECIIEKKNCKKKI